MRPSDRWCSARYQRKTPSTRRNSSGPSRRRLASPTVESRRAPSRSRRPTRRAFATRELVSIVLGVPAAKITVVSEFLGGGFGGKAYVWPHTLLATVAAKVLNRPVRLQLTRAQMYSMVGHQPATIQTIALGAGSGGKLTGIRHEST